MVPEVAKGLPRFKQGIYEARLKVCRAQRHIQESASILRAFEQSEYCKVSLETDADTGQQVFRMSADAVPQDFQLAIGECFRSLDCAFDYIVTALMDGLTGNAKRIHFPMHDTRDALKATFKAPKPNKNKTRNRDVVEAVPRFALMLLCQVKPYRGGNYFAWEIRQAANLDKHNMIIPTFKVSSIRDVVLAGSKDGPSFSGMTVSVHGDGTFNMIENWGSPITLEQYGKPTFSVTFPESMDVFAGKPVLQTLIQCVQATSRLITLCEVHLSPTFSHI